MMFYMGYANWNEDGQLLLFLSRQHSFSTKTKKIFFIPQPRSNQLKTINRRKYTAIVPVGAVQLISAFQ